MMILWVCEGRNAPAVNSLAGLNPVRGASGIFGVWWVSIGRLKVGRGNKMNKIQKQGVWLLLWSGAALQRILSSNRQSVA